MRKIIVVLALALGLGGVGSALAQEGPPEDGFSCEITNPAEARAKESSSKAPSGGAQRGEDEASDTAQFNFCDQYGSN